MSIQATSLALSLLLALPVSAVASPAPGAATATAAPAPTAVQATDFRGRITQAIRIGDYDQVGKVLKSDLEQASLYVVEVATEMGTAPSKETGELLKALVSGWKRGPGGNFAQTMQRYHELMDSGIRRQRTELKSRFDPIYTDYLTQANLEIGEQRNAILLGLAGQLESIGDAFLELDDKFYASEAYYAAGWASDSYCLGEADADFATVSRVYTKSADLREEIDLIDDRFRSSRGRANDLDAMGYAGDVSAEEAAEMTPGMELGEPFTLDGTFTLEPELLETPQPGYSGDPAFLTWTSVYLKAVGSTVQFGGMELSPTIKRTAASEIEVVGTDGASQMITLTGKSTLVETTVGTTPRPWAFLLQIGGAQDIFQGIQANLQGDQNNLGLYVTQAGGMRFEVDGVELVIYDTNLDGVYGSLPLEFGYAQLPEGRLQPEIDCMRIDGAKQLVPFSEYAQISEAWYRLESQAGGANLVLTPAAVTTGVVQLASKGPKPAFCVVRGRDKLENVLFDLTAAKKLELPVGQYRLFFGAVREGKRADAIEKVLMLPGKETGQIAVLADESAEVRVGAPFTFQFEAEAEEGKTFVPGRPIMVKGAGGEVYTRFWNARPQPEVAVRPVGSKKGTKPERMGLVQDPQTLNDVGFQKTWFPLDLTVEHKFGAEVEVQLTQKKSPIFGKIESEWLPAQ